MSKAQNKVNRDYTAGNGELSHRSGTAATLQTRWGKQRIQLTGFNHMPEGDGEGENDLPRKRTEEGSRLKKRRRRNRTELL